MEFGKFWPKTSQIYKIAQFCLFTKTVRCDFQLQVYLNRMIVESNKAESDSNKSSQEIINSLVIKVAKVHTKD